jgi:hypothetical protein
LVNAIGSDGTVESGRVGVGVGPGEGAVEREITSLPSPRQSLRLERSASEADELVHTRNA